MTVRYSACTERLLTQASIEPALPAIGIRSCEKPERSTKSRMGDMT